MTTRLCFNRWGKWHNYSIKSCFHSIWVHNFVVQCNMQLHLFRYRAQSTIAVSYKCNTKVSVCITWVTRVILDVCKIDKSREFCFFFLFTLLTPLCLQFVIQLNWIVTFSIFPSKLFNQVRGPSLFYRNMFF